MNASQHSTANAVNSSSSTSRKRKPGKKEKEAPTFLRKTYRMIDTCDPDIATWAPDGFSFVVKKPEKLEQEILPVYFNSRKMTSFVRQLNFYGFRKIKSDPIKLKDKEDDKIWRFHHDYFQRGREDLLLQIKKSNHTEAAEKAEVDALKEEVQQLRADNSKMQRDMDKLAEIVHGFVETHNQYDERPLKKPKLEPLVPPSPIKSFETSFQLVPQQSTTTSDLPNASSDLLDADLLAPETFANAGAIPPMNAGLDRFDSIGSLGTIDDSILGSLIALEGDNNMKVLPPVPDTALSNSSLPPMSYNQQDASVDPALAKKIHDILAALPKDTREVFIERLAALVADPEGVQRQVDALTKLAETASEQAAEQAGVDKTAVEIEPLAASILGSYLQQYLEKSRNDE